MKTRKLLTGVFSAVGIILLILDGKTAVSGAAEGLTLCIRCVIPSLFPFFVLSNLLTASLLGSRIPSLHPLGRIFGVPAGTESLLLTGFLGGYPVGAQSIAQAWKTGQIPKQDAERMLAFCNNAGPSFLFGIIGPIFSSAYAPWLLWLIHFVSALAVSRCIPSNSGQVKLNSTKSMSLFDALNHGLRIMAAVCGWVILFRVCIAFLNRWFLWMLPDTWQVAFIGILELTNGCLSLPSIANENLRFLLCSGMLGFGGVCVTMQTSSVTQGLSLNYYFPGKIIQSSFSMLLSWIIFPTYMQIPLVLTPILLISIVHLRNMEKRSGNPMAVGV